MRSFFFVFFFSSRDGRHSPRGAVPVLRGIEDDDVLGFGEAPPREDGRFVARCEELRPSREEAPRVVPGGDRPEQAREGVDRGGRRDRRIEGVSSHGLCDGSNVGRRGAAAAADDRRPPADPVGRVARVRVDAEQVVVRLRRRRGAPSSSARRGPRCRRRPGRAAVGAADRAQPLRGRADEGVGVRDHVGNTRRARDVDDHVQRGVEALGLRAVDAEATAHEGRRELVPTEAARPSSLGDDTT
mmetsp:Transcript_22092/g.87661  ORF Transcript_22092/g.87661 Transcript_22092/m.87661 type:complete len:243 (+) Transcript_22092:639-1367(+)